jgi:hypothetical protein
MISERALAALRCTAGLIYALPIVRARVRDEDRVLLDVMHAPFNDRDAQGCPVPQVPACAFHHAVAEAYSRHRLGEQLQFLDLTIGVMPAIDLGVLSGDRVLPGGVVRVTVDDAWVHALAIARSVDDCLVDLVDLDLPGLACHADRAIDITILHVGSPAGNDNIARMALDTIEIAAARCMVGQLEDHRRTNAGCFGES